MPGIDLGMTVTFVNNAQAGLKNLANGVKNVGENAQATHNRLKAIQVVIAGILLTKTIELGKSFLSMATSVQNLDIRLAKFAGGVPKATAVMHHLNEEFGATGFSVEKLGENWIKLQSVMNNPGKVTATLDAIANSVAAMGGNDGDVEAVTTAFQRMVGKGAPALKEVASLATQTGITTHELAKAAGESFTVFDQRLRGGFIHAGEFIDDFIKVSKEKFGNYALGLHFTIGGAMNSIANSIKSAISEVGSKTDLFARITLVFNNIDKAFEHWAATIKQGDIDRFFTLLASWEQPVRNIASLIYTVGSALTTMAVITGQILTGLPAEIMEWGIVGYIIGGKKLGALFAMLAYIGDNTGTAIGNLLILLGVAKEAKAVVDGVQGIAKNALGGLGSINTSGLGAGIFAGSTAEIAAQQAKLTKGAGVKGAGGDEPGAKDQAAIDKRQSLINDLDRTVIRVNLDLKQMNDELGGDTVAGAVDKLVLKTNAWKDAVNNLLDRNEQLAPGYKLPAQFVEDLRALVAVGGPIDQGLKNQIIQTEALHELDMRRFALAQAMLQNNLRREEVEIRRASSTNVSFNMLSGTAGGQLALQVDQQRFNMLQHISEISQKIEDINKEIQEKYKDKETVAILEGTKSAYITTQAAAQEALKSLSAAGEAGKQVWAEWGAAIETGVGDALVSVIDHTKTLGQIATQMYASITKAAANYLVKLGEIALMGDQAGGTGGGSGWMNAAFSAASSIFGGNKAKLGGDGMTWTPGAGGFAKGAAFHGAITPFANGGILSGPTMFGLAGEAGDEAIMPLRRGAGGKLGVAASGGSAVHIHINALDTQNAVEFIQKNAFHIGRALSHRSLLNRDMR